MPPKHSFWLCATKAQARDTGMALTLICLLFALSGRKPPLLLGMGFLVLNMVWPSVFKPAAKVWFGLSHVLGTVMSKVLLGIVFFVVVTPLAVLRRAMGKDSMRLSGFKKGADSVFRTRDHLFTGKDLEPPY